MCIFLCSLPLKLSNRGARGCVTTACMPDMYSGLTKGDVLAAADTRMKAQLMLLMQVYFTVYENLKGVMRKREGLPQPLQHMVSAVGAGALFVSLFLLTHSVIFHTLHSNQTENQSANPLLSYGP